MSNCLVKRRRSLLLLLLSLRCISSFLLLAVIITLFNRVRSVCTVRNRLRQVQVSIGEARQDDLLDVRVGLYERTYYFSHVNFLIQYDLFVFANVRAELGFNFRIILILIYLILQKLI